MSFSQQPEVCAFAFSTGPLFCRRKGAIPHRLRPVGQLSQIHDWINFSEALSSSTASVCALCHSLHFAGQGVFLANLTTRSILEHTQDALDTRPRINIPTASFLQRSGASNKFLMLFRWVLATNCFGAGLDRLFFRLAKNCGVNPPIESRLNNLIPLPKAA